MIVWSGRLKNQSICCSLLIWLIALFGTNRDQIAGEIEQRPPSGNAPLQAKEATARIKLPEGFTVSQFAAEPDVVQPIAMTIDHKGRLWVVENYAYPIWLGGPHGRDRILIFEDADGDGRFDRRTVFFDRGTNFTGIELGFGGVWVCSTPNLLFIPDRDGDDRPDGPPVIKLDGWSKTPQHNMFNGLKWGPDGWLWGCNGILSISRVGKPGTADLKRVALDCGVWRYHPSREVFEAVAHGTTNPWGLDFDLLGEAFITNCVIPHLFHVIPGAHFQRMFGEDVIPNRYELMETCADHIHWAGGRWQDSRDGKGQHGEAGGGHAHVGAMIYLGDNWPDRYRNAVFTCNLHGRRVNHDRLERQKSGYVARHEKDFLTVDDTWFRGLELKYGPDGAVYLTDWYDTGECHETDSDNAHRENGRIYKVAYGTAPPVKVDLSAEGDLALARYQLHKNDWHVRTARRLLQERAVAGKDLGEANRFLSEVLTNNPDVTRRLRALWALSATGGLEEKTLQGLLHDASEHVRAWAIRLLCDDDKTPAAATVSRFAELARTDPSPKVRLSLASALQRLPHEQRWQVAEPLASHEEDAADRSLCLMIWYGIEPLVPADRSRALSLAAHSEIPIVRRLVARRVVAAEPAPGLAAVVSLFKTSNDAVCLDLLTGIREALRGRKHVVQPQGWSEAFVGLASRANLNVIESALLLGLDLDEPRAVAALKRIALGDEIPADSRSRALAALVERHVPNLSGDLQALVADRALRGLVLRSLAAYDDPATPEIILRHYGEYSSTEREDAIATLTARPAWAKVFLEALERGQIARRDVSVSIARQLQAFGERGISEQLEKVWGKVQPTSKTKAALLAKYKSLLARAPDQPADLSRGRAIFNRTCLACHKLYDSGGDVGPDLTGSDRANADYILENVLDPSAAVSRDYTLTNLAMTDGRLIAGIIRERNDASLVIQTANERIVVPREDIETIKSSTASMMPEGQLEMLSQQEIRDLFAYLASARQVQAADMRR
jgi:putative membrane-bound dehydrogenase-like protein